MNKKLTIIAMMMMLSGRAAMAQDDIYQSFEVPHPTTEVPAAADTLVCDDDRTWLLDLPPLSQLGTVAWHPYALSPFYGGLGGWQLHRGLNGSLSLAGIVGLGRRGGSGFANTVSLMYADTLTSRLSYAVGGYLSRLDWRGHPTTDGGLSAMLSYRFDDHWEATVFAQKSLLSERSMLLPYYMRQDIGDRIGAELRYSVNPAFSFSVGVSVWRDPSAPRTPQPPLPPR